jgi:type III secretion protein V
MGALQRIVGKIAERQEVAVVGMLILTLAMMVMPVPPVLADVLIATNIGLSVLLMMAAIQISAPIEFSTLPSLILLTTTFRLSISITTSRMVLVQGDAGEIIRAFGEFVIAGNVVVGLVVYLIITIVQFLVISKGSERVAEVAARFTLDALPGKQISIDTDLKNGDIDKDEARRRRAGLATESQLFGAMDGAMKFVKGDSIASLVMIVINLVGGIVIGSVQRGLSFADAVQTYSLLAVGDGLIAQIPALLISLTAGLLVTRSASEAGRNLGQDIVSQIIAQPRSLQIGAVVLAGLGFVPGFPTAVFLTLACLAGAAGWALAQRAKREAERRSAAAAASARSEPEAARLTVALGAALSAADLGANADAVAEALGGIRRGVAERLGLPMPRLRLLPEPIEGSGWRFEIDGVPTEQGEAATVEEAMSAVRGALMRSAGRFVGVQETRRLIQDMERDYPELVQETLKVAPLGRLAAVLRRLLDEQVPIVDLWSILDICQARAARETDNGLLAELARYALRNQICFDTAGIGKVIPLLLIEPALEQELVSRCVETHAVYKMVLDEAVMGRMISVLNHYARQIERPGASLAILASTEARRHLAWTLKRAGWNSPVLSYDELAPDFQVEVVGTMQHGWLFPQQLSEPRAKPVLAAVGS